MFDYTIYKENSQQVFNNTCKLIERSFPNAHKSKLLVDFDGTTIQTFTEDGKDIDIYDDYEVGAVFVKSGIDLGNILQ